MCRSQPALGAACPKYQRAVSRGLRRHGKWFRGFRGLFLPLAGDDTIGRSAGPDVHFILKNRPVSAGLRAARRNSIPFFSDGTAPTTIL
jgi:hypothetical protein